MTAGTAYTIREAVPAGYAETAPLGYGGSATPSAGQSVAGPVFGDVLVSSVTLDFSYLVTLARHYGQPGTFATGDLNGDGKVDFSDFVIVARNYGHALSAGVAAATTAQASPLSPLLTDAPASRVLRLKPHRSSATNLFR